MKPETKRHLKRLWLPVLILIIGSNVPTGFALVMLNNLQQLLMKFIEKSHKKLFDEKLEDDQLDWVWGGTVAAKDVGKIIGAVFAPMVVDKLGRKGGMFFGAVAAGIGASCFVIAYFSEAYPLFHTGRFLGGIGDGFGVVATKTMLQEIAPQNLRGAINMANDITRSAASLICALLTIPELLGSRYLWFIVPTISVVVAVLYMISLLWLRESPKYLYIMRKDRKGCEHSLKQYQSLNEKEQAELLREYDDEANQSSTKKNGKSRVTKLDLLRNADLRQSVYLTLCFAMVRIFCGNLIRTSFSSYLLKRAGIKPWSVTTKMTTGIGALALLMCIIGAPLLETIGRMRVFKLLVPISLLGWLMTVVAMILKINLDMESSALPIVATFGIFVFCGLTGPIVSLCDIVIGEIFPEDARATGLGFSITIGFILETALHFCFIRIIDVLGGYWLLFFIVPFMLSSAYILCKCPETNDRPVTEIVEEINNNKSQSRSPSPSHSYSTTV